MRRLILPAAVAVALVLALVGAAAVPVQQFAAVAVPDDDRARVAVACPVVPGSDSATTVAAGSPQAELASAALATPERTSPISGSLAVLPATGDPLIVSAPRQDELSATSRVAVGTGEDRGLSMVSCGRPLTSAWFAGVRSGPGAVAEVELINSDAQDASVDLTVYGPEGRVTAPGSRGVIVDAHSRRVLPLGPVFSLEQPVSIRLATSSGRVSAVVRQRIRDDAVPSGADWLPAAAEPSTSVVVPGVPAGGGGRELVVVNPGDRTATVTLQVLGADGPTAVPGVETIDLPPQTSRSVPLDGALAGSPVGLLLTSEQPVTAAVLSGNGGAAGEREFSAQVATTPLAGPGVLALSAGRAVTPALMLSNAGQQPARARITVTALDGTVLRQRSVEMAALAQARVPLPRLTNALVRVEPETPGVLYASVAVRARLNDLVGTASLAMVSGAAAADLPEIRHDPRIGG